MVSRQNDEWDAIQIYLEKHCVNLKQFLGCYLTRNNVKISFKFEKYYLNQQRPNKLNSGSFEKDTRFHVVHRENIILYYFFTFY